MGIDGKIRQYLHTHAATKSAWVSANGLTVPTRPGVEIVDVLTEMHTMKNRQRDWTPFFTGDEFYAAVRAWIETSVRSKRVAAYVICMDYQRHVPHRKHAEQKRRADARVSASSSSSATPAASFGATRSTLPMRGHYRSGAKFTDAGIVEPQPGPIVSVSRDAPAHGVGDDNDDDDDDDDDDDGDNKDAEMNDAADAEMAQQVEVHQRMREPCAFDLRVVLGQRKLRSALIAYVAERMERDTAIPGVMVVFDYNGVVDLLRRDPTQSVDTWRLQRVESKSFKHRYGESDKKMLFWLRVFHNFTCWVRSVDGDMLPLLLQYLTTTLPERAETVYWIYSSWRRGNNSTGGLLNMSKLMVRLHAHMKWETRELMLACILCGTDYFKKKALFDQVGHLYILYAVQQSRAQVDQLWRYAILHDFDDYNVDGDNSAPGLQSDAKADETRRRQALEAFEIIVRRIYNLRILHRNLVALQSDFDHLAADDRKTEPLPPTLEQLQDLVSTKWNKMKVPTHEQIQVQLHLVAWHLHYWSLFELNDQVSRLNFFDTMIRDVTANTLSGFVVVGP